MVRTLVLKIWPICVLVLVAMLLAFTNHTSGTVLSGWDTLHPEFNLPLYLQRIFWGAWQEHQGLGAVAAQAHASELGRLWYFVLGSLLPENLFRYGYFWITLTIGPIGVFYLLKKIVSEKAALIGGLFYLLNLGTMQNFYLPLEMFATAYAFLPWLFWAVYQKKTALLVLLFLVSAPMAHTPTLWFINFVSLVIFAFFLDKKWSGKVLFLGLIVNSFWLLPTAYFIFNHGADVANSHISQQFSSKALSVSKEFGNLFDASLIKGYLFDWGHFDFVSRQFTDLLSAWKSHLSNPFVLAVGYGSFAAAVLGIFISLKKKIPSGMALVPVLLISVLGMMTFIDTEALRFPFTKFSLLLMLSLAVYLGIAIDRFKRIWVFIPIVLVFYMWPAFTGNLICNCERISFPSEYQQTFDWFNRQDHDTRIAPFPVDSVYGWGYYDWGYEGAGFRWFGLPQSILDREFDRWMPTNENYYWEVSYAVYSKNLPLLESVLEKYRVNWLLVDGNIVNPSSPKAVYLDEIRDLINKSGKIKLAASFGKISVYSFDLQVPTRSYISLAQNLPSIEPSYRWGNLDQAYFDLGDYTKGSDYIYNHRTLFSGRSQADLEFNPEKLPKGELVDPKTYPTLSHGNGYLIKVQAKNISGKPFSFWIEDLNSRRAALETYLSKNINFFVLPPMEPDGLGYTFHFDSNTVGKEVSKNELESFEVWPIDYWGMVTQKRDSGQARMTQYESGFIVEHPNQSLYRVDLNTNGPATLILAQSYDPGWVALGATDHQLVNNWANGWTVSGGPRVVYLFFWPQLLEFLGFGMLGALLLALCFPLLTRTINGLIMGSGKPLR